jgi:hypothetical protein
MPAIFPGYQEENIKALEASNMEFQSELKVVKERGPTPPTRKSLIPWITRSRWLRMNASSVSVTLPFAGLIAR